MRPAVLLRHDMPDGSGHFDWLIQRPGGDEAPLISFRLQERIDLAGVTAFAALRLPDHRAAYLTYEGEVSGGRGRVRRVAEGEMEIVVAADGRLELRGRIGAAAGRFEGWSDPGSPERWRFVVRADA